MWPQRMEKHIAAEFLSHTRLTRAHLLQEILVSTLDTVELIRCCVAHDFLHQDAQHIHGIINYHVHGIKYAFYFSLSLL